MTVEDMFGNMNDPILQEFPGKVASSFIDDDVCPSLRQIDIDMDRGVLTLTFSEPVEAQNIDPTGITFLSMPNASIFEQFTMSGGISTNTSRDVIVIVQLLPNDLNDLKILKSDANACLTISPCYLC